MFIYLCCKWGNCIYCVGRSFTLRNCVLPFAGQLAANFILGDRPGFFKHGSRTWLDRELNAPSTTVNFRKWKLFVIQWKKIIKINTLLYQWSFSTHNIHSLRPNSRPIIFETSRSACGDKIGCKIINVFFCCRIFISYLNFVTRIHALLPTIFGLHSNYAHSQRVTGLQNPIPCTTVTNEWWLLFFFPFCFNIYRLWMSLICSCLCKLNRFIDKKHDFWHHGQSYRPRVN